MSDRETVDPAPESDARPPPSGTEPVLPAADAPSDPPLPAVVPPVLRDDDGRLTGAFLAAVRGTIEAADAAGLAALVGDLHEADLGEIIGALDADERPLLVGLLGDAFDFSTLVELDESVRVQLIEDLPPATVAEGVRDLDSDDAVYILEDLDEAAQDAILDTFPAAERLSLERSLDFPEESAGRLMQTEFIAVAPTWTVGQVIDYCRETEDLPEDFYEIHVVDPGFRLLGTVALDRILRAKRMQAVGEIVDEDRRTARATDDREDVARIFERYNLISLPVIDDEDRLIGVITADDVVDVVMEEAEEDLRALAGVGDEEISDTVWYTTRNRFLWLLVNLFTAFLAAGVIGLFEDTIAKIVALAALAPIVAGQGGNAATQTMTVAVRAIATREVGRFNIARFVNREIMVSFLNGAAFALLVGLAVWGWYGERQLGAVIGGAMIVNLIAGGLAGVAIPLAVDKLNGDPAVISGVFVTTVTDCVGFFAVLGLATWWYGIV
ncbi:magnesium transporter [Siculibacillus lacustris]|uniref:Magnesium transporter MgtE n=1 Tax=Siculibacillus lacustris TaxID=1549641 RepID=A0A4Q9VIB9_9HYPH|nr:magnesium transporter [Siculibacillus lacustris]TBW34054.1 magnesium transporter [Siculibacillus lacustris]